MIQRNIATVIFAMVCGWLMCTASPRLAIADMVENPPVSQQTVIGEWQGLASCCDAHVLIVHKDGRGTLLTNAGLDVIDSFDCREVNVRSGTVTAECVASEGQDGTKLTLSLVGTAAPGRNGVLAGQVKTESLHGTHEYALTLYRAWPRSYFDKLQLIFRRIRGVKKANR